MVREEQGHLQQQGVDLAVTQHGFPQRGDDFYERSVAAEFEGTRTHMRERGEPPETFADQVMSQVTPSSADNVITIDFLLPKLAWAAAFVMAAFLTSEVIMNTNGLPSLTAGTDQLASAWDSELDTAIITP